MNPKRLFMMLVSLPLLLFVLSASAQDKQVTGKVTDLKDGKPIAGASVVITGVGGTQTGADGTFSMKVPASATKIVISFIGYTTQELLIGNGVLNVSMLQSNSSLNDVVVVAYGTRRKGDLTGSVTAITAKDFQKGAIASSEQLLQGKVAGLQVTSGGGSAGGGSKIRIRTGASLNASNDPLIVIDGVPVESNGIAGSANLLNTINPNDIESMSVLKDASATALYGSRASNGVIIITTKKGVAGKVKFNFNTQVSAGMVPKTVDILSADQITSIINEDAATTGINTYKNVLGTANTDWQKEIYQTAMGFDNNLSASGSIKSLKLPFRVSLGYLNQAGILKTNKFDRMSTSINLNPKYLNDHLSVNVAFKYSKTANRFADEGAIGSAVSFDPTQPVYSGAKNWGGYYEWLQTDGFPIALATRNPLGLLYLRDNNSDVNRIIGNVQLDYKLHFLPDLHVLVNLGIDNISGSGDDNTDSSSATNYLTKGRFVHYEQKKKNTLADVSLFYTKELKDLNTKFDVLIGHSYQDFVTEVSNFAAYGQDGTKIPGSDPTYATDKPEYRLESYLGRLNITIANKYLLTGSIRRDASSKFASQNRVGYFPAFAGAWKLRDEFFKGSKVVTDLKLRVGWGETGQQDGIGYYSYLPVYTRSNTTAQYQFGDAYYSFLRPSGYDPNIRWESTQTSNIALDYGFANNRITGSVDFFKKKTKDLLAGVPIAPGANFVNQLVTNVGNMEVKGVELTVNTVPVKNANLTWELGFNYTYSKQEITNLLKQQDPNFRGTPVSGISGGTGNNIGIYYVGYAPFTYNVYKQVYDPSTGKPIEGLYEDINRDGKINDDDRYFYKKPAPDVLLGINTQVIYKNLSVGLAMHGSFGNYVYNNYQANAGVLRAIKNPINFIGNASTNYLETSFNNNQYLSDYYIENASFLRLDNINIGYNFGKVLHNAASLRGNLSVQNVFVITNYKGLDPEIAADSGVDNNIYPRPRIISLGFNLDF